MLVEPPSISGIVGYAVLDALAMIVGHLSAIRDEIGVPIEIVEAEQPR